MQGPDVEGPDVQGTDVQAVPAADLAFADRLVARTVSRALPPGAIDCDVHPEPPRRADLLPYLDEYWTETVTSRDIDVLELTSMPSRTKPFRRSDWPAGGVEALRANLLDPFRLSRAILNPVSGVQALFDPYLAAALARATNDWIAEKWLAAEPRLAASIVVSLTEPTLAAEEIERRAPDRRFVQVLTLAMGETPLGRRINWPIFRAAERHGLPIGIHAGSLYRHATTQSGFPSTMVEDYAGQHQGFASQVASLVAEGVFVEFPKLKVVLIESGVTWLPSLMWRVSKDWRGVRSEVPWVTSTPAKIVRDHVRLTLTPLDAPPNPADVARILDHLGSDELLLFSTDYPHHHFEGGAVLPEGLPEWLLDRMVAANALATYPRLEEVR